jgi:hypothetical protein
MHGKVGPDESRRRLAEAADCNSATVCETIKAVEGALTRNDGLRRSLSRQRLRSPHQEMWADCLMRTFAPTWTRS